MNKIETFQQFLANSSEQISVPTFLLNLVIAALFAWLLGKVYFHYGEALSNRKTLARNFLLITVTTTLVISIVKSSLALSLGLVGALSIVRFRTAVKEPEELAYLFLAIALGLGFGADQTVITVEAFIVIAGILMLRKKLSPPNDNGNMFITIKRRGANTTTFEQIVSTLKTHCAEVSLRRSDESVDLLEAIFLVNFPSIDNLNKCKSALLSLDSSLQISVLDSRNIS